MELAAIPAGSFMMGQQRPDRPDAWMDEAPSPMWDEMPVHKVIISRPFYIACTEVTNDQYEQFDPSHRALRGKDGLSRDDDEPAVFVSWHEATAFCRWLSRKEGRPYRLPSEAEWEYACRAGTATAYHAGDDLPQVYHKNQALTEQPIPVVLHVARTPPNAWGLYDMHGNVEEWCLDWYGPYEPGEQADPLGRADGDFRVSRGGSHSTELVYLRSAARMGTLPEDRSGLIGFRLVQAEMPAGRPLPPQQQPLWARDVRQQRHDWPARVDMSRPYFAGPRQYVNIPAGSNGPLYSFHNHDPALAACPNGDMLAIWYTTRSEKGRELTLGASRLRLGRNEWDKAAPFWGAPCRNNHAPAMWWDGKDTLYHFNGLSADGAYSRLAIAMRTSTDSGATWSKARLIAPEHDGDHQLSEPVFRTADGAIAIVADSGLLWLSHDKGATWEARGRESPIAGIHAGVVQLADGRLLAIGRGQNIDGHAPMSISADLGHTWTRRPSPFPPLSGGQRAVLKRLAEGALLYVAFTDDRKRPHEHGMIVRDEAGVERRVYGVFAAVSFDEGQSWPIRKPITAGDPPRRLPTTDGNRPDGSRMFTMDACHGEPMGYLAACQTPDGIIHLISSIHHYEFNLAWLKAAMPAEGKQWQTQSPKTPQQS